MGHTVIFLTYILGLHGVPFLAGSGIHGCKHLPIVTNGVSAVSF